MKAETSSLHCESVPLQNDKPGTATFGALSCSYFCILSHFFDLKKSQPLGTKPIQEIYMASLFTCGYLLHSLLQALFNNSFLFCSEKHRCYGRDISRRDCTQTPTDLWIKKLRFCSCLCHRSVQMASVLGSSSYTSACHFFNAVNHC